MGIGNTLLMTVLRSPIHGIMSRALLILSYEGRRSGRRYELPLQYVRDGDRLVMLAGDAAGKTWWRNFEDPAMVTVLLQGKERAGQAHLVEDGETKTGYLRSYSKRFPSAATGRPKVFGRRRWPTDDELRRLAATAVLVAVDLEEGTDRS